MSTKENTTVEAQESEVKTVTQKVAFATIPLDYLNEVLELIAERPYKEVTALMAKVHASANVEVKDIEVPEAAIKEAVPVEEPALL